MNPLPDLVRRYVNNYWAKESPERRWAALLQGEDPAIYRYRHILALLPANPRCKFCNAPFRGPLAPFMEVIGRGPSSLNPHFCGICLETIPVGGAEIEGTLFFADVRGSTTLAEKLSAQEFRQIINRFFVVSSDILTRSDALVDKLVGDQAIGLYVPGFAGENHAKKALRAGMQLLQATGYDDEEDGDGPWLPVGIGIHTGTAFFGAVGSDEGITNITALGDAVNVAARLSSQAPAGELFVSDSAAQAAGLDVTELREECLTLRGRNEPVTVWVLDADARRSVTQRRLLV